MEDPSSHESLTIFWFYTQIRKLNVDDLSGWTCVVQSLTYSYYFQLVNVVSSPKSEQDKNKNV